MNRGGYVPECTGTAPGNQNAQNSDNQKIGVPPFLSVQESNQKGKWGKLGLAKKRDVGGMSHINKNSR